VLMLDWMKAWVRGDNAESLNFSRTLASQGTQGAAFKGFAFNCGLYALMVNRPREAITALATVNPYDSTQLGSGWYGYWDALTLTYHLLGDHDEELKQAARGRIQYPTLRATLYYEMRALSALGRTEEIWKRCDEASTLPYQQEEWTPGGVMNACAEELRFHGFLDASRQAAARAIAWRTSQPDSILQRSGSQSALARSYYVAERWSEARKMYARLSREQPDDIDLRGQLGVIAARVGDTSEAKTILGILKKINRPYLFGAHTYWRARITSLLGEKEEAVRLLRDALSHGVSYADLHADMDLEPLRDYPPFQELVKPRE